MARPAVHNIPASFSQIVARVVAMPIPNELEVVSLFAGCGGLDLGFIGGFKAGNKIYDRLPYRIIWANELEPSACRIYRRNLKHNIIEGDINKILKTSSLPRSADVVLGGFPCQDFSIAGKRRGFQSERGGLYQAMVKAVEHTKPKVFIAENKIKCPQMSRAIDRIKNDFSALGYSVSHYECVSL